jgi:predicted transcriptional regulator
MSIPEAALAHVHVHDVMNTGILTTDSSTSLRVVARLMAEQRVHVVAVADPDNVRRPWGMVTTLDIAAAAAEGTDLTAGEAAAGREIVTISSAEQLDHAAWIMAKHQLTHLMVIDPATGHPTGVLSSLDVAAAYGS